MIQKRTNAEETANMVRDTTAAVRDRDAATAEHETLMPETTETGAVEDSDNDVDFSDRSDSSSSSDHSQN